MVELKKLIGIYLKPRERNDSHQIENMTWPSLKVKCFMKILLYIPLFHTSFSKTVYGSHNKNHIIRNVSSSYPLYSEYVLDCQITAWNEVDGTIEEHLGRIVFQNYMNIIIDVKSHGQSAYSVEKLLGRSGWSFPTGTCRIGQFGEPGQT